MMHTKVSIGVCVRNGEDHISEAITSIRDQDFSNDLTEVIFVDDGSKDKTLSIIQGNVPTMKMKARIFHQGPKGLGTARNMVVNNAHGEYILWVDCDMRLPRDFVRKQVEFMDRNPNVGIGKGRYRLYDSPSLVAYLENIGAIMEFLNYEQERLPKALGTGGSIYRVDAIRKVGGFKESIRGVGEDMDAEHRIKKAGWILKIADAEFCEMRRTDWKALWNEYYWHGSGGKSISNEARPKYVLYKTFPPAAFLIEFYLSCNAYRLVHKSKVFLLPFHWVFKRTAWCLGFVTSHVKTTGPARV